MVVEGAVVMVENIIRYLSRPNQARGSQLNSIRDAAHEVQRPVFYSIGIIITAYLPIFTLQRVEGRLFKPMAWTVSFALLGSLLFSMLIAPALTSFVFRKQTREWRNPLMTGVSRGYRKTLGWAIRFRWITVMIAAAALGVLAYLIYSGIIGSEFLPHLDEPVPIESERRLCLFILTRFLHANRYPPRIKCGAGFRLKTLRWLRSLRFSASAPAFPAGRPRAAACPSAAG